MDYSDPRASLANRIDAPPREHSPVEQRQAWLTSEVERLEGFAKRVEERLAHVLHPAPVESLAKVPAPTPQLGQAIATASNAPILNVLETLNHRMQSAMNHLERTFERLAI